MYLYLILCFGLIIHLLNNAFAIDPKRYEQLESGIPYQEKVKAVGDIAQKVNKTTPHASTSGAKDPKNKWMMLDWDKLTRQQLKKNEEMYMLDSSYSVEMSTDVNRSEDISKKTNSADGQFSTTNSSGKTQSSQNGEGKRNSSGKGSGAETTWQTVGPLGPNIRKDEAPKLSPKEEKYQKEKEEFLKKFKSQ